MTFQVKPTDAGVVVDLARATGDAKAATGDYAVIPVDAKIESLERFNSTPSRSRGTTHLLDENSFIAAVRLSTDAAVGTVIYATPLPMRFTAVFNAFAGDEDQSALIGWGDHRAVYTCPLSRQWRQWIQQADKPMSQTDFAAFVERNLKDFATPSAAEMVEIASTVEATTTAAFKSAVRLDNGQRRLVYEETVQSRAGEQGNLTVPSVFTVTIPVLEGGLRYQVDARLRYRFNRDTGLVVWYELSNADDVLDDAFKHAHERIGAALSLPVLLGTPAEICA